MKESKINTLKNLVDEENELLKLIKRSSSKQDVLRSLGVNVKNSHALKILRRFYNKHDIKHDDRALFTINEIEAIIKESINWSDAVERSGRKNHGFNYKTIKKYCDKFNIDYSHFGNSRTKKYNIDNVFVSECNVSRSTLKAIVMQNDVIPYICDECYNTGIWNGKKLTLQLDHMNGINSDNRIENLRFLCPNCHTQTETYAGKNKK